MTLEGYLKSFKSTWGMLFGLAVSIALAAPFLDLAPPWPSEKRATVIAVVACLAGIAIGYSVSFRSQRRERYVAIWTLALALILLIAYFYISSLRVFEYEQIVEGNRIVRRVIVGTELQRPEIDRNRRTFELIELYGFDGSAWTDTSVTNSRISLLASYASFFWTFTFGIGVLQRHSYRLSNRAKRG